MLQLPLNIQLDDSARFDNFFAANQQLTSRLKKMIKSEGDFVYIWGATDSGKTHLAQALCHEFNANKFSAAYLPLSNTELTPDILVGMNCMDFVCLDDIDAVCENQEWAVAIFDLYNNMKLDRKNLLVLGSAAPSNTPISLADLKSRLSAMEIYKLDSLNDTQRQDFFQQRAANRGIEISNEVASFVLSRKRRSVSDLITLLDEIDHLSIVLKRKVTIPLIKKVFGI